jgi:PAS domain S-box-containing protein
MLMQRGWMGDMRYMLTIAEMGGGYRIGQGVAGWVAKYQQPLIITGDQDPVSTAELMENNPYTSVIAIPLRQADTLLGVLTLFSDSANAFGEKHSNLFAACSNAITTAIHNADLYAQQEARIRDLANLQEIAEQPKADTDPAPVYRLMNERIAKLIGADMCGVFIYESERNALIPQVPFYGLPDNVASAFIIPVEDNTATGNIWRVQPYWTSNDLVDEPLVETLGLRSIIQVAGIENTALFPMQIGGERIGMIAISNKRDTSGFTPNDLQSLRVLSTQAAIVVENLRLYQRERLIDSELVGLQEMTHAIGALSHQGEFFGEITERIARLTSSKMCGILLYDERQRVLQSRLPFYGVTDDLVGNYVIQMPSGSVMEQLWQEEDYWYSNRVASDSLVYEAGLDSLADNINVEKTLIAAMSAGGRRIGVVQVSNKFDDSDYDEKDARLLQIFATQAAAIIENARLYQEVQERAEQADSLRRVAEIVSSIITTEQSFQPVLAEIARITNSEFVYINVIDYATNNLVTYPRWSYGLDLQDPILQDMSDPRYQQVPALSGRPFYSNDVINDPNILDGYKNLSRRFGLERSLLVPLSAGERQLGELGVSNRKDRPYNDDDVVAMLTLGAQVASALDRLLLYEATGENLRRRVEELDAIARVSNELTLTEDLQRVLQVIQREATVGTYADFGTIVVLRPHEVWRNENEPELSYRIGDLPEVSRLAAIEKATVLRGTEPLLVQDYETHDLPNEPENARSALAASFTYIDQVVGVIHVYHPTANYFDERASGFLATLATKASLAYQGDVARAEQMQRGTRLRQRVDQLSRIFELGQMIQSNTDVEVMLEAIAYSVSQSVGYDTVLITIFDESAGVLRRVAHAGMPLDAFESTKDRTISYDALQDLLKDEYRMSESYFFPIERIEDWFQPPMRALSIIFENKRSVDAISKDDWRDGDMLIVKISGQGGNLLGLLTLDRPYDNKRPTRSTIEVLEIFAHQASTMIENTRLFIDSRRSAEQEAQLALMMESISRTMDKDVMVREIARNLYTMLVFDRLTVVLSHPDGSAFDYLKATPNSDGDFDFVSETRHSLERTALGHVFDERQEFFYTSASDAPVPHFDDLRAWRNNGENATLIVPMMAGGDCLGVMHVGMHNQANLADTDRRQLVLRTAQLVASSIQNARLFDQAVNLQILTQSVVESIQQGIVVLDNSGHIISVNNFMQERYGWDENAIGQDLFAYRPDLNEFLYEDLQLVLDSGEPHDRLNLTSMDRRGELLVRNFYIYPLRSGDQVRGAVLLVEDVSERTRLEQTIESRANQLAALTDVSTRITASLEREEVLTVAMEEMGWIIPFSSMSIWRRNGSYMVCEGLTGVANAHEHVGARLLITEVERFSIIVENQRVEMGTIDPDNPILPGDSEGLSWMGIPMVTQGHVTGLMLLSNAEADFYEQRADQHVAFAFASQVTTALANADLFEQTFTRTNELGTVLEAAQATSLSRDIGEVFKVVSELMFGSLEVDEVTIMTWDNVDDQLIVRFAVNRFGQQGNLPPVGHRYDRAQYPARQLAIDNREAVVIVDLPDAKIPYQRELDELREVGHMARMLVPLIVSEKSMGLMLLQQQTADVDTITQQKVRLGMALGAQVAIALENNRLEQETSQRFEELLTINELSQAISSTLKLEDMLPIIRQQVPQVTSAEEMYLALYDEEKKRITFPLAVRGKEDLLIAPRDLGDDEVSYVIKRRHSLSLGADYFDIDDLRKSMGIVNGEGNIKSYMGVPLISGDQVLGVLAIRNTIINRTFNLNDDRILSTVGTQLAAAIQNARLFEQISNFADELNLLVEERTDELEEERDRLDTLYQITSELARTLDMEHLLERALGMVGKAVSAEDGVILLIDPATDQLHSKAWYNPDFIRFEDDGETARHPAEGLATWLIQNDESFEHIVIVDDLHQESYWDANQLGGHMRSALAVILENNEDPMGVMVLLSDRVNTFTENHLKLLVPAANQVAASINSADLYQLIRSQAERMGRFLRSTQEDSEKYSAILESIADGVMLADSNGEIILFNAAAERILKVSRDEVMGQSVTKLAGIYGATIVRWSQLIDEWTQSLSTQDAHAEVLSERIELDDLVVSTYLSPVFIGDSFLGTVSVFRDITSDVEADRIKSEFIENVSHEFRTPLTPIKGYADLLLMGAGGDLSDMQANMVGTIKENVDRLSVLVNDVLNIAKLDNPDMLTLMQQVSLSEIIPDVVGQVAGRPQNQAKDLHYSVDVSRELPMIRADRDKLIQIINNVVDNAFNYTPAGGNIAVSADLQPDKKHVLITVEDSGVGIPEEFRDAAWRRFERYDQHALQMEVAGTGLGLPLVRELVRKHNGNVWFESEVNQGTTFYIKLPIEQPNYLTDTVDTIGVDTESLAGD